MSGHESPIASAGRLVVLLAAMQAGCTATNPALPPVTQYPGTAMGTVVARLFSPRTSAVDAPGAGIFDLLLPHWPAQFHYRIRDSAGVEHIVGAKEDFPFGACVRVEGYADGPSRTHWSYGRVTLTPSEECSKAPAR